jgi:hypothetical protein
MAIVFPRGDFHPGAERPTKATPKAARRKTGN